MVVLDEVTLELLVPTDLPADTAEQLRETLHALVRQAARNIESELARIANAPITVSADR